jgi:hypothetical protein
MMDKISKMAICKVCEKEKLVVEQLTSDHTEFVVVCEECYLKKSTYECPICNEDGLLPLYHDHLINKHTIQDLANHMCEIERNSKLESW